nr:MAG TPA: hypothetical protein [Caudoviricetes sp.]
MNVNVSDISCLMWSSIPHSKSIDLSEILY